MRSLVETCLLLLTLLLLSQKVHAVVAGITQYTDDDLNYSVHSAERRMDQRLPRDNVPKTNKLAVFIMLTFPVHPMTDRMSKRLDFLRCSLHNIQAHIAPWTPLDIFVWINETTKEHFPSWVAEEYPEVVIMPTPESSWTVPPGIIHESKWVYRRMHSLGYYLMGRWRMTYAFDFARAMGYSYMLQMDDDAFVVDDLDFNIVEYFRKQDIYMGFRNNAHYDDIEVLTGLPELTAAWALSNSHTGNVTAVTKLPVGPLFEQFAPTANSFNEISTARWSRRRHYLGAFMVFSIEFWYREYVQSYLSFVLKSGKDMSQRWQEQGVVNIMRSLFVANANLMLFDQNIIHSYDNEIVSEHMLTAFGICPRYVFGESNLRRQGTSNSNTSPFRVEANSNDSDHFSSLHELSVSRIRFIIHFTHERISSPHKGPNFILAEFLWEQGLQCALDDNHIGDDNSNSDNRRGIEVETAEQEMYNYYGDHSNDTGYNDKIIIIANPLKLSECHNTRDINTYGLDSGLYGTFDELLEKVDYFNRVGEMPAAFRLKIRNMAKKLYVAASNDVTAKPTRTSFLKLVYPSFQA